MLLGSTCIYLAGIYIFKSKIQERHFGKVELGIISTKGIDEKEGQIELA